MINRAQFRILGAVQALVDGRPAALGAPKQRALLAVLLLHKGAVVSRDRLVDLIWGADPPASAIQSLQVYVHGLRRALGADRIQTEGAGYRIRLEDAELDLERFERLVEQGRRALEAGDPRMRQTSCAERSACGEALRSATSSRNHLWRPKPAGSRS